VVATQAEAEEAFRRDPKLVHRSLNDSLHGQYWRIDPATGAGAPRVFRSGKTYIIAPEVVSPALPPPHAEPIPADEGMEADNVRAMTAHLDRRRAENAGRPVPAGAPSDPAQRTIYPGAPRDPAPGKKPAVPVSHAEVMQAIKANPDKVHKSDDYSWHAQVYTADHGRGAWPRAYRSGNTIIVDPDYPMDGTTPVPVVPPRGVPSGGGLTSGPSTTAGPSTTPGPSNAAGARQPNTSGADATRAMRTVAPGVQVLGQPTVPIPSDQTVRYDDDSADIEVTTPKEKKPAKWDLKDGNLSRERTTESKTTTRDKTVTDSSGTKAHIGLKGIGNEWKQRQETQTGDKVSARETTQKFNLGPDSFGMNFGSVKEDYKAGAAPDAPKTRTELGGSFTAGPGGVGGGGTAAVTSDTGAKAAVNAGAKIDDKGISGEAGAGYTGASGVGAKLTIHGGIAVEASDPVEVNGKFQVTYTVTKTSGAGVGGSYAKPGGRGPAVGLNVGSSTANAEIEVKVFDTKEEAQLFKLTAATQVSSQRKTAKKATTVDGVAEMKVGESRGTKETNTDTLGGSVGMSGVDVGLSKTDSMTHGLTVKKVSDTKVQVTPDVSETHGTDASISAGGVFGNTKGGSETDVFDITFEFDLSTAAGKAAFEQYCKTRIPPPPTAAKWVRTHNGHAIEDHDAYKFAGAGTIGWGEQAYQDKIVDEKGTHERAGGGQSHKVDLNWVRHLTFDENVHSETNIVAALENGKAAGIAGQMTVGGESGEFNRKQLGEIFMGAKAKPGVEVKPSGEWTLSADIDQKVFDDLAKVNKEMRLAKTQAEKIKIYGELAKKGGARMLSGQVRSGGKKLAWNLELKGDSNFPGPAGRDKLNELRSKLAAQLKSKPTTAGAVAAEAKDTIEALNKRLAAISDESKYTDLPDELRQEQKDLVKDHIAQFKSLRSQAISASMRGKDKEDLTDTLKRASRGGGYDDVKKENREVAKLRDRITIKEAEITALEREIVGTYKIVNRMFGGRADVRHGEGVKKQVYMEHNANAKMYLASARMMDERLKASAQKARDLRDQYARGNGPKDNETNLRALDAELANQIKILDLQLGSLRDAARAAYIVTSDAAIGRDWNFYKTIKVDGEARSLAISGLTDDDL
jgi:hypothetical protein